MFQKIKAFFIQRQTSGKEKAISGLIALGYVVLAGTYGQRGMQSEWFHSLVRPAAMPPDWVFGAAWTVLFILLGLAGYIEWNFYETKKGRNIFTGLYGINGLLMVWWTNQFVIRHNLGAGLLILLGIIVIAEAMIITAFYTNKKAVYPLLPYLAWVLFAAYLNANYLILNS